MKKNVNLPPLTHALRHAVEDFAITFLSLKLDNPDLTPAQMAERLKKPKKKTGAKVAASLENA